MRSNKKFAELTAYQSEYSFLEARDFYYGNFWGLYIAAEEKISSNRKVIFRFYGNNVSYRILYEPLISLYYTFIKTEVSKFNYQTSCILMNSRYGDVFHKEDALADETEKEHAQIFYLPFDDVLLEIISIDRCFYVMCPGGEFEDVESSVI